MIRSKPPSDAYRDGWDRVFQEARESDAAIEDLAEKMHELGGRPETTAELKTWPGAGDALEMTIRTWMWRCHTCNALVSDPENHQYHAVVRVLE